MTLDWKRVRLLIWLRNRQAANARKRNHNGSAFLGGTLVTLFAVLIFAVTLAAGYFILSGKSSSTLIGWDFWVALSCYLWLAGLAAEAQRADPVDTGRLLHLPVSLREAFIINFVSSCISFANIVALSGALGLACGQAFHRPVMLLMIPVAVIFLLGVTAWVQVLRTWFLKVFQNPRRRAWLSIVAGLFLALAGQLPNLVNMVNLSRSRHATTSAGSSKDKEPYDPAWAVLPPDAKFETTATSIDDEDGTPPRIYSMPDRHTVYRLTYTRTDSLKPEEEDGGHKSPGPPRYKFSTDSLEYWKVNYWEVRGGVWRAAQRPAAEPPIIGSDPGRSDRRFYYYPRASENLEGQPADLRDLRHNLVNGPPDTWKEPSLFRPSSFLSPSVVDAHAFVPLGWPAWVASKATTGIPVLPFVVSMGGLGLVCAGGLRRAWRIHGQAILMTEKPGTPATAQAAPSKADRRGLSRAALAKASSFLRPLRPFPSDASCLVRAMTRQWRRSVEIRFLIITACALAAGAVVASIYLQYAEADILGAFRITCGMAAVLILAYATLFLNQFGYDRGGCRAMMLAPVSARTVLMAKNLATGRLVLLTSVPFAVLIAVITGQWTSTLVVWVFLLPAAILLTLALGNSSSIAFPFPVRIGQRAQMRAAAGGLTRGLLNFLLYLLIALVLQIPQIAASAAGPWVGYAAAAGVFAGAAAIWKMSFEAQAMQLAWRMGEVADTVGRATDM